MIQTGFWLLDLYIRNKPTPTNVMLIIKFIAMILYLNFLRTVRVRKLYLPPGGRVARLHKRNVWQQMIGKGWDRLWVTCDFLSYYSVYYTVRVIRWMHSCWMPAVLRHWCKLNTPRVLPLFQYSGLSVVASTKN